MFIYQKKLRIDFYWLYFAYFFNKQKKEEQRFSRNFRITFSYFKKYKNLSLKLNH